MIVECRLRYSIEALVKASVAPAHRTLAEKLDQPVLVGDLHAGELVAVEMVSYWVNNFDLQVVPVGRKVRAVARPFTQPVGLRH